MTAFTRLGSTIWDWEPFTDLSMRARVLWLALYTSGEAKGHVPGLWQGGIPSMSDAARMPPDEVIGALDELLERSAVEYDPKTRVARLCELPDAGERPTNGKVIRGWWTKFKTVPACPVRDAHITTLKWLMETGATQSGEALTPNHLEAWAATFAGVAVPSPRRRGVRRLADSDTGNQIQPSLFPSNASSMPFGNPIEESVGSAHPQSYAHAVDNSASVRQLNEINGPERVSDRVSDRNRIPDTGYRIPDSDLLIPERGMGGGHESGMRPTLSLVPPFSPAEVIAAMAIGLWDPAFDKTHQNAIGALIPGWVSLRIGLADIARLAQYSAFSNTRFSARWLVGCDLEAEIGKARRALDWRDVKAAAVAESAT